MPDSRFHDSLSAVRSCPDRAIDAGWLAPYGRPYDSLHRSPVALPTMRPATRACLPLRVRRRAGDRSSRRALPDVSDPPPGVRPEPSSRGGIAASGRRSTGRLGTAIASNGTCERHVDTRPGRTCEHLATRRMVRTRAGTRLLTAGSGGGGMELVSRSLNAEGMFSCWSRPSATARLGTARLRRSELWTMLLSSSRAPTAACSSRSGGSGAATSSPMAYRSNSV
jgi:hypothetical protein